MGDLMLIILQFFLYLCIISFKLYSLLDYSVIFSSNGSKLKKYIKGKHLTNTANNLVEQKNDNSNILLFNFKSPIWYKKCFTILLVTITIILLKIAFSYKFLVSNFLYINIFNKNINISYILDDNYNNFKITYYVLFSICTLYIVSILINIYYSKKNYIYNDNNITNEKSINGINIKIGITNENEDIYLNEKGLYQNILITGSIGSGKTTSGISNIFAELIQNNIYGVIIDVKGTYINDVYKIAKSYGKQDKVIEISLDSDITYNPLDNPNMSAIELSSMVKQVLALTTDTTKSDTYWLDKAQTYIRDFIILIRTYNNYVDFSELHKLTIDINYLGEKLNLVKSLILDNNFTDEELFNLNSAIFNIKNEFLKLDERTSGIIKSEITRMTNLFLSDYKIHEKFCKKNTLNNFYSDNIFVLSLNIGENKLLSKIISTYFKLDFQRQVLSQKKYTPIFFICDEYQELANAEDASFFAISREYKCINILSMQSYSSLINTIKNENTANVIIQNLVNKIWYRNDDLYTIDKIIKQVGKFEKNTETFSYSENSQNSNFNFISNNFRNIKSGLSESLSVSKKQEYILSEEDITKNLKTFEAICLLSDGTNTNMTKNVILKRWEEANETNKIKENISKKNYKKDYKFKF